MTAATDWNPQTLYQHFEGALGELRAHIEQRFEALTATIEQRFASAASATAAMMAASAEAVKVAAAGLAETLRAMNEFRQENKDNTARFIDRKEAVALIEKMAGEAASGLTALEGRVAPLVAWKDQMQGRGMGLSMAAKIGLSVMSAILTILSIAAIVVAFTRAGG